MRLHRESPSLPTAAGIRRAAAIVLALAPALGLASPAGAQGAADGWTYDLAVYGWMVGLKGEAGAKDVKARVDVSFSDVADALEMGAMMGFAANHGHWTILGDAIYASIGSTSKRQVAKADVDVNLFVFEGDLGYDIGHHLLLFGGLRHIEYDTTLKVTAGALQRRRDGGEGWTDPLVGLRWMAPIGERGSFVLRGDVGGFGVGSDFAWNALGVFEYRVSTSTRLAAGYRILDVDYQNGSGADQSLFDIQFSGPAIGAVFHFE